MTNEEMKAGRFAKWVKAKARYNFIIANLNAGKTIQTVTQTRITKYSAKHAEMFKATKSGLYVQSGKSWLCLDFTKIVAV